MNGVLYEFISEKGIHDIILGYKDDLEYRDIFEKHYINNDADEWWKNTNIIKIKNIIEKLYLNNLDFYELFSDILIIYKDKLSDDFWFEDEYVEELYSIINEKCMRACQDKIDWGTLCANKWDYYSKEFIYEMFDKLVHFYIGRLSIEMNDEEYQEYIIQVSISDVDMDWGHCMDCDFLEFITIDTFMILLNNKDFVSDILDNNYYKNNEELKKFLSNEKITYEFLKTKLTDEIINKYKHFYSNKFFNDTPKKKFNFITKNPYMVEILQ